MPMEGFMSNEVLKQMLEIEVNKLTFSPKFKKCQKAIVDLQDSADKLLTIQNDPSNYIYEYFEELKRQTDIRREDLKLQIDTYSDEIIRNIDDAQEACNKMSKEENEITNLIDTLNGNMNDLLKRFDSFEFNDEKYDTILGEAVGLKPQMENCAENYKNNLIGNKVYSFKFDSGIVPKDFFGSILAHPVLMDSFGDSKIVCIKQANDLIKLCEFTDGQTWKLAYRATEDGFASKKFHAKSNGIRSNLIIIKSGNGNIFGGYTDLDWKPEPLGYAKDPNAFLFSLVNQNNVPMKFKCVDAKSAIYRRSGFLVEFGNDLVISSNSNECNRCVSHLNERYQHPDMTIDSTLTRKFLAGSENFLTTEIELYYKV